MPCCVLTEVVVDMGPSIEVEASACVVDVVGVMVIAEVFYKTGAVEGHLLNKGRVGRDKGGEGLLL